MDNQTLLQKADVAISDIQAGGAYLPTAQARTFVRRMIEQPTLIKECRSYGMGAPVQRINRLSIGDDILVAVGNHTALNESQRTKPTFDDLEMTAKQFKAQINIPYEVMEDNIESTLAANNEATNTGPGGLRDSILAMIAQRAAFNVEKLGLLSSLSYVGNANYATQDGWLQAGYDHGNVVDYGGSLVSKTLFKKGANALPNQYLGNIGGMKHYVSVKQENEWRDNIASRATGLGDSALTSAQPIMAYGAPVQRVIAMPDDKGLFVNPQNLIFGIWRKISLEFGKDIEAGHYIIVMSCRIGFMLEEPEATVEYNSIGLAA